MSECLVCGRERFVKGGKLPPEQPDDAKHCLAWFSHRDGEDCYKRGYARLESELREARVDVAEVQAAREWIFQKTGVGGGTRPLSFITASHEQMARERAAAESALSAERTAHAATKQFLEVVTTERDHCQLVEKVALSEELESERTARRVMREALGFLASVIKSGEPWTATCQQTLDAALAAEPGEGGPAAGGVDALREAREHLACLRKMQLLEEHKNDAAATLAVILKLDAAFPAIALPPEGHPRAAEVKNEG